MANTVTIQNNTITVDFDALGTAFDVKTYFPYGIRLSAVYFRGSQALDKIVLREGAVDGNIFHEQGDPDGMGTRVGIDIAFRCSPYVKIADCVFGDPASKAPRLVLEYA